MRGSYLCPVCCLMHGYKQTYDFVMGEIVGHLLVLRQKIVMRKV